MGASRFRPQVVSLVRDVPQRDEVTPRSPARPSVPGLISLAAWRRGFSIGVARNTPSGPGLPTIPLFGTYDAACNKLWLGLRARSDLRKNRAPGEFMARLLRVAVSQAGLWGKLLLLPSVGDPKAQPDSFGKTRETSKPGSTRLCASTRCQTIPLQSVSSGTSPIRAGFRAIKN